MTILRALTFWSVAQASFRDWLSSSILLAYSCWDRFSSSLWEPWGHTHILGHAHIRTHTHTHTPQHPLRQLHDSELAGGEPSRLKPEVGSCTSSWSSSSSSRVRTFSETAEEPGLGALAGEKTTTRHLTGEAADTLESQ